MIESEYDWVKSCTKAGLNAEEQAIEKLHSLQLLPEKICHHICHVCHRLHTPRRDFLLSPDDIGADYLVKNR